MAIAMWLQLPDCAPPASWIDLIEGWRYADAGGAEQGASPSTNLIGTTFLPKGEGRVGVFCIELGLVDQRLP